jgi:hypothetical protein
LTAAVFGDGAQSARAHDGLDDCRRNKCDPRSSSTSLSSLPISTMMPADSSSAIPARVVALTCSILKFRAVVLWYWRVNEGIGLLKKH